MTTNNNNYNKEYNPTFFIVPYHIYSLPDITFGFLRVYESIFQFWNRGKSCYLSLKQLAEKARVNKSEVCRAILYFKEKGELYRRKEDDGRYYFTRPTVIVEKDSEELLNEKAVNCNSECPLQKTEECLMQQTSPVSCKGHDLSHTADININNINKEIKEEKNIGNPSELPLPSHPLISKNEKNDYAKNQLEIMQSNNPYNIDEQSMKDWMQVRRTKRAPITETAWTRILQELGRCQQLGLQAKECFLQMVTAGWQSLKAEWFVKKDVKNRDNTLRYVC